MDYVSFVRVSQATPWACAPGYPQPVVVGMFEFTNEKTQRIADRGLPRRVNVKLTGLPILWKLLPDITVAVAQLAERQVVVLDVAGSSPVGHP